MPPDWLLALPAVNAGLNGLATVLLLVGFVQIKRDRENWKRHRNTMLLAFGVSVAFLICYVTYHAGLSYYTGSGSRKFEGVGLIRPIYFFILISHIILAAAVPVLAVWTIVRGIKGQFEKHRRIARITFPVWLYVSVTGVIIYFLLYHCS